MEVIYEHTDAGIGKHMNTLSLSMFLSDTSQTVHLLG